ncbi:hypothetical protein [Streptomyces sp. NPDC048496]|uniref:hypothetical protein n=1 Tax=Streptomyces sp. NPDC048496 TaxID=3365558 RepID=UPI00372062C4
MKPIPAAVAVAVLTLLATGCTKGGGPKPSDGTATTSAADGARCGSAAVTAPPVEGLPRTWTFTAVRKTDPRWGGEKSDVVVDKPFVATVEWESDRVDEPAALAAIEGELDLNVSGSSDTVSELDRFLSDVKEKKAYVGYAAVERVTVPLSLKCHDGITVHGKLATWIDAETGVVVCATKYGKGEAPAAALKAQAEFCR